MNVQIYLNLHNFDCQKDDQSSDIACDYFKVNSEEFLVTEASQLIKQGDIALSKAGDEHPYYLLRLFCDPYTAESTITDGYNHVFPQNHRVITRELL